MNIDLFLNSGVGLEAQTDIEELPAAEYIYFDKIIDLPQH